MARQRDIIQVDHWKEVPGHPGYFACSDGQIRGPRSVLTQIVNAKGYARVPVYCPAKKGGITVLAHRMVAAAFLGPCPPNKQVNHINNVRDDNRASNLEYVTAKENCHHRKVHGTFPSGANNGRARLTRGQVDNIRARFASGEKPDLMAAEFGVHRNTLWMAVRYKTWAS